MILHFLISVLLGAGVVSGVAKALDGLSRASKGTKSVLSALAAVFVLFLIAVPYAWLVGDAVIRLVRAHW